MSSTKIVREKKKQTGRKNSTEPPWDVLLHNDWENSMSKVVLILTKVLPGMTLGRAIKIMYEAHSSGRAVAKRCHKELAELYKECLQGEGLTVSLEPAE